MSLTPREIPTGAVRYNTDSNKMEVYIGSTWMEVAVSSPNLDGGVRGLFGGGATPSNSDVIDFITISSQGNAIDFANSSQARRGGRGCGSRTRGIHMGGAGSSPRFDVIDFITIASTGNATDFGNLHSARTCESASNQTRGLALGGSQPGGNTDQIDFITIASTGNGVDFGDMTNADRADGAGFASPTRGFQVGTGGNPDSGEFVTIATTGNATEFTDGSFS